MDFYNKVYHKILDLLDVFNLENIIYYLSIAPLVILIELLIVGWDQSSLKKIIQFKKSTQTDVFFYVLGLLNIYNLITVLFSFGIFHVLARLIYEATAFDLIYKIHNPYYQFAVLFIFSDLKDYFSHYIFHKYRTLWSLHEFHHSATEFCILTKHRGHFLESALKRMIDVLPFAIFGSVKMYFIVKVLTEIHQLLLHSSIKSNWGFVGKYIIVSPAAHRLHHSSKREHYDKNFGATFIIWDRIFSTYHSANTDEILGVEKNIYNKDGVIRDIFKSIIRFYRYLKADMKNLLTK